VRALLAALRTNDLVRADGLLAGLPTDQLPRLLVGLPRAERAVAYRLLPKDRAAAVFEAWPSAIAAELLEDLRDEQTATIFADLDPDDRVQILDELPASVVARLLAGLGPRELSATRELMGYPEESVGRRMVTGVVTAHPDHTVAETLQRFRQRPDGPDQMGVPVLRAGRLLSGMVPLHTIVTSPPQTRIGDLVEASPWVATDDDQETAAREMQRTGARDLPVVDQERRFVGLVQVDNLVDILTEEEAEDAARSAGVQPQNRPYLTLSPWRVARSRIVWLVVLLLAAFLTVGVLDYFEAALSQVIELALFIPLLIGTGGNTGSQSVTTVVRAMSVGDVSPGELGRVVLRELQVGAFLGVGLAALVFVPVWLVFEVQVAITLALSLLAICLLATCAGALVPMLARRLGFDPAIVSAPFITTVVDATGLLIYFLVAKAVFGL